MHKTVESILNLAEASSKTGLPGTEKIRSYKEQSIELDDIVEGPTFDYLRKKFKQGHSFIGPIVKAAFTVLARNTSEDYRLTAQKEFLNKIPLNIPEGIDGQIFRKIGSGTRSTVYFLNASEGGSSVAIATDRRRFKSIDQAELLSQRLLSERNFYAKVFGNEQVVAEMPFIWADDKGFNRVSIARPFVAPIQDAFLTDRSVYKNLFEENPALRSQIQRFLENFSSNQEGLLDELPIDLIGKDNLVISGAGMETSLLLLDPHKREGLERDYDKRPTLDKLDYLNSLVS